MDRLLLVSGMDHPEKRIGQHRNVIEAAAANGVQKIVYTSIIGDPSRSDFSPIIQSNRQTEQDIINSGLNWSIGRNGLYLEPDLEYLEQYKKEGGIANSAGSGKCTYTSRGELGAAYARMLLLDEHNNRLFNLVGYPVTQQELADSMSTHFGVTLPYREMTPEEYTTERKAALGEFLGTVIGGIYEGIHQGAFDVPSHYELATGRVHKSLEEMILAFIKKG